MMYIELSLGIKRFNKIENVSKIFKIIYIDLIDKILHLDYNSKNLIR